MIAGIRKPTIYEALAAKLGRIPTNAELKADVDPHQAGSIGRTSQQRKVEISEMGAGDCETEKMDAFLRRKMESAMERLQEWLALNPCASPEEGSDELFAILIGKRDQ